MTEPRCECYATNDQYAGSVCDEWTVSTHCPIHGKKAGEDGALEQARKYEAEHAYPFSESAVEDAPLCKHEMKCASCGQDISGGFEGHYTVFCHKPDCLDAAYAHIWAKGQTPCTPLHELVTKWRENAKALAAKPAEGKHSLNPEREETLEECAEDLEAALRAATPLPLNEIMEKWQICGDEDNWHRADYDNYHLVKSLAAHPQGED